MKTISVSAVLVMLSGVMSIASAQCDDPYDANLCVYFIEEAQQQFARNASISEFWNDWGGRDYIDMIAPDNCYPGRCGFSDIDDARLTIKAASSYGGLHLLSIVTDNVWVDRADATDWGADAIDFYFDRDDAESIWNCTGCRIGLYDSYLTYNTQQFQVWMGATSPPDGVRMAYYDEQLWSWQTMNLTWDQLASLYHIQIDFITINANQKAQEWFFPWEHYGKGVAAEDLRPGLKLGFSGGYNDKDGDNPDPDCLRWLLKDPWFGDANYWGDFEIVEAGDNVVDPVSVLPGTSGGRLQPRQHASGNAAYYTLQGKRIPRSSLAHASGANAVMVQRGAAETAVRLRTR